MRKNLIQTKCTIPLHYNFVFVNHTNSIDFLIWAHLTIFLFCFIHNCWNTNFIVYDHIEMIIATREAVIDWFILFSIEQFSSLRNPVVISNQISNIKLCPKFCGVMTFGPESVDSSSQFKIIVSLFFDISFLFVFVNCCAVEHCRIWKLSQTCCHSSFVV